jgi:hypothetical protein
MKPKKFWKHQAGSSIASGVKASGRTKRREYGKYNEIK